MYHHSIFIVIFYLFIAILYTLELQVCLETNLLFQIQLKIKTYSTDL
jgi:hypothetical protein